MNRLVVRKTTAGVAQWLIDQGEDATERGIVIGRDARNGSAEFARDVADVAGSRRYSRPCPFAAVADAYHRLCRQAPRRRGWGDDHRQSQPGP